MLIKSNLALSKLLLGPSSVTRGMEMEVPTYFKTLVHYGNPDFPSICKVEASVCFSFYWITGILQHPAEVFSI